MEMMMMSWRRVQRSRITSAIHLVTVTIVLTTWRSCSARGATATAKADHIDQEKRGAAGEGAGGMTAEK